MAAQRKTKITKAEQAVIDRIRAFDAVGLSPASALLQANADISVQRNTQSTVQSARREDAFDALKAKMEPGAYDAARRLEADMRIRRGEDDRGQRLVVVNGQAGDKGSMDRRLDAAKRVDAVLMGVGERDAWLLTELIYPAQRRESWRLHVAYITGETNEVAQGAVVRGACANLARAYDSAGYVQRLRAQ